MPKVNETWALAKSTVNYFCRLMNGADISIAFSILKPLGQGFPSNISAFVFGYGGLRPFV
jgi:hypothetical protein